MDKLISMAEAFGVLTEYYHHRADEQHRALWDALNRVPEAVVRCEDCVHCSDDYIDTGFGAIPCFTCDCFDDGYGVGIKPGHYCSYGERRTE